MNHYPNEYEYWSLTISHCETPHYIISMIPTIFLRYNVYI